MIILFVYYILMYKYLVLRSTQKKKKEEKKEGFELKEKIAYYCLVLSNISKILNGSLH